MNDIASHPCVRLILEPYTLHSELRRERAFLGVSLAGRASVLARQPRMHERLLRREPLRRIRPKQRKQKIDKPRRIVRGRVRTPVFTLPSFAAQSQSRGEGRAFGAQHAHGPATSSRS